MLKSLWSFSTVWAAAAGSAIAQPVPLDIIALSEEAVPGESNLTYRNSFGTPYIDINGEVGFSGEVRDASSSAVSDAIFATNQRLITMLARVGDPAASDSGVGSEGIWNFLGYTLLDASSNPLLAGGNVMWTGRLVDDGTGTIDTSNNTAIWIARPIPAGGFEVRQLMQEGNFRGPAFVNNILNTFPIQASDNGRHFTKLVNYREDSFTAYDEVIRFTIPPVGDPAGIGTRTIVRREENGPNGSIHSNLNRQPAVADDGTTVYGATLSPAPGNPGGYSGPGIGYRNLPLPFGYLIEDAPLPPTPFDSWTDIDTTPVAANNAGEVLFKGRAAEPSMSGRRGLFVLSYADDPVSVTKIYAEDDPAPITLQVGTATFGSPNPEIADINDNGNIVFTATFDGPGITSANDSGLFYYSAADSTIRLIAREGDPIPGMTTFSFSSLRAGRIDINNNDLVIYLNADPSAQDQSTGNALVAYDASASQLTSVINNNDTIDISRSPGSSVLVGVNAISIRSAMLGGSRAMSETDDIAMQISYTGGDGIFTTTLELAEDCKADVNGDGVIDSADFFAWVNVFGRCGPDAPAGSECSAEDLDACDVNDDGSCNSSDFFAWVNIFSSPGGSACFPAR